MSANERDENLSFCIDSDDDATKLTNEFLSGG